MTITLTPDIEQQLAAEAQKTGTTLERLALEKLRAPAVIDYRKTLPPPRDDWERLLRTASSPCGVALSDEAVSSEGIYE